MLLCAIAPAQTFTELKQLYAYDRSAPLDVRLTSKGSRGAYTLYDIAYSLPGKQVVDGYLAVPQARGRKPAVIWMHSSGALSWLGDAVLLAQCGAVSLVVNAPAGVGGGAAEGDRDAMILAVVALRRAVDVLEARDDVDPQRIAIAGHSFGAMMSAVAASVDPRFKAAVFEVGLLGMSIHIGTSPHPWAQGVRPKELKWYDTAHDIDDLGAIADRARFLAKALNLSAAGKIIQSKSAPAR
jgi:cephalosporin-C deacetylase-like acetyl esterase